MAASSVRLSDTEASTRLPGEATRLGGGGGPVRLPAANQGHPGYAGGDPHSLEQGGAGVGEAIVGELIKSYGFKLSTESGLVEWSLDNITEAFKDSPVWTTVDWLTAAFAPAKMGTAAFAITRGAAKASSVGRALSAGDITLRQGIKLHSKAGAPTGKIGRAFSNPITAQGDNPEIMKFVDKYGASPDEVRSYADVVKREMNMERAAFQRLSEDAIRLQGKVKDPDTERALSGLLEAGASPKGGFAQSLSPEGRIAYEKTYEYRNALHEAAFDTGLIGEKTYLKNLETYMPRMYEEYMVKNGARINKGGGPAGRQSFLARTFEDHSELTRIWDPTMAISKMAAAADVVATQNYAQKLSKSVVAKTGDDLIEYMERHAGDPEMRQVLGITDAAMGKYQEAKAGGLLNKAEGMDLVAKEMGWRKFSDVFESAKLPEYLKHIPDEMKDRFIDPAAMEDVLGVFEGFGGARGANGFGAQLNRMYQRSLGLFRASKTAYNPATHVRNYMGGVIFHHLTTGGVPKFVPTKGIKALVEGGAEYTEAVKAGILGADFNVDVRDVLKAAFMKSGDTASLEKLARGQATAIDFMGNSDIANLMQRGAGFTERIYRQIDEVWKLDAFIEMKKKLGKGGVLKGDELIARATLEVNKYMPQFSSHSPVGDVLRKGIPFASFTTEALRVWKNAMQTKPHLAFAWQHFSESASYGIGAANGYSMEEIDSFREMAPEYTHNKKMLMMPFKVQGRPAFLEMGYLIPMGNLSDAEEDENIFFSLINPTQNPVVGAITAAATGVEPFSKREVAPRFTEQQLGITIDGPKTRMAVGLGEYMLSTMMPPLMPVGGSSFAAMNFLELARGQKNPITGEPLEPSVAQTVMANLFGMRTVSASVGSQIQNVKRRERKIDEKMKIWQDVAKRARVNGDVVRMNGALDEMVILKEQKELGTSTKYIEDFLERTRPGSYSGVSTRMLEESYKRSLVLKGLGNMNPEDLRGMTEISARLRSRSGSRSRRRSR